MPDPRPDRRIPGIHHVTAICGGPQENLDFYAGVLGQRFVKNTVNFGDPSSYHLYYGDRVGGPGTIMTFFAWPDAHSGRPGRGVPSATRYSVPRGSLEAWARALEGAGVAVGELREVLGDEVLTLDDPHGLRLELVADAEPDTEADWPDGPVPEDRATRGFHGMTLSVEGPEETGGFLEEVFGFEAAGEEDAAGGRRYRLRAPGGAHGDAIDLVTDSSRFPSAMGVGVVHHIAFRAKDDGEQAEWGEELRSRGFDVTPVRNRLYFQSIYFREPGGVLFEIATDSPGFTHDESVEELGTGFMLPPWLESDRERIEAALPEIEAP